MYAQILVVEDNPANLDFMLYLLSAFGHVTMSARDGEEALRIAVKEKPDLILCDIHLPKLDGYEVVSRLKNNPDSCSIPIVALTALAMVGDRDRVLRAGFDGYVPNPSMPKHLLTRLRALSFRAIHLSLAAIRIQYPRLLGSCPTLRRSLWSTIYPLISNLLAPLSTPTLTKL
jgi:CheY-like chemotaxis protein